MFRWGSLWELYKARVHPVHMSTATIPDPNQSIYLSGVGEWLLRAVQLLSQGVVNTLATPAMGLPSEI